MKARIGFLLFCIAVAWGYWAQRRYMAMSRQEFLAETKADRSRSQLIAAKQFISFNYENGVLVSTVRADSGLMLNSGDATLTGNVKYIEMDENQTTKMVVATPRAFCQMAAADPGQNFFDTSRKINMVKLPDKVDVRTKEDYLQTENVLVDLKTDLLTTDSPVSILGPSRTLDAVGFSYHIGSQSFKLLKNIRGHYIPSQDKKQ